MFHLFQKDPATQSLEELQAQLSDAQSRRNGPKLTKACYALGVHYMENGDSARAMLWLSRADTIYSARDEIYNKVGKPLREGCSERIRQLDDMPLLTNQITVQIEERAEELTATQLRLWGLMTMARLGKVGQRLSVIPGCEVLGELDRAVELIVRSFQTAISAEEMEFLRNTCDRLYQLGDAACFWDPTQQVEIPNHPPMQVFDLNGMLTLTELNLYLDSHITLLTEGEEHSDPESGLVPCGLLPDYYLRTGTGSMEEMPQMRAEAERIWDDYEFVRTRSSWKEVSDRLTQYEHLDILL